MFALKLKIIVQFSTGYLNNLLKTFVQNLE